MTDDAESVASEAPVWREEEVVVVRRDLPLPPLCLLSGQPATQRVACLFHWREQPLHATGPAGLMQDYLANVWKATLQVPLADGLILRRRIGWVFFAVTALLAVATIAGLVFVQMHIGTLPKGDERTWWKDIGVPVIALGGGLLTGLASIGSYYIMPMPTVRLKPVRITQTHIWLTGAAPEYLAQLPQR